MNDDDAPTWELIAERFQRARHEHPCCQCTKPIRTGETYRYVVGRLDGEFVADRMHVGWCPDDYTEAIEGDP